MASSIITIARQRTKGNCHKEHVGRDAIEDLIVQKTAEYILQPEILSDIATKLWQLQAEDDTREDDIAHYKKKLNENKKATDNIVKAIETGLASETLLARLQSLESEKTAIEGELAYLRTATFGLSEAQIHNFIHQFLTPDDDWEDYKRRIIKSFIHEVYLYDDHFTVTYNIGAESPEMQEIKIDDCSAEVFDQQSSKWSCGESNPGPNPDSMYFYCHSQCLFVPSRQYPLTGSAF